MSLKRLNYELLQEVEDGFRKKAFVPMPGGQAEPVAGAGMMTAAQAAPMGMDPAMAGGAPPMDPSMGGAPPMDPMAMLGGDPMAALGGAMPEGNITMSISEFIALIGAIKGDGGGGEAKIEGAPGAEGEKKPKATGTAAKLDQILAAVSGGGAAGAMPPPGGDPMAALAGGGMPPMPPM